MQIEYVSEYERFGKKLVTEFTRDISACARVLSLSLSLLLSVSLSFSVSLRLPLFFFLNFAAGLCVLRN